MGTLYHAYETPPHVSETFKGYRLAHSSIMVLL